MPLEDLDMESWDRNRKLVLSQLGEIADEVKGLRSQVTKDLVEMKVEVATLKTKVAIYALLIGGAASLLMAGLIGYLRK